MRAAKAASYNKIGTAAAVSGRCSHDKVRLVCCRGFCWTEDVFCDLCDEKLWSYFGSTLDSDDYAGPVSTPVNPEWVRRVREGCSHPSSRLVVESHHCWCNRCGRLLPMPNK
eukprot:TRINITY_DN5197_c2_g2_i1.p1 TRINITY_DN5197_c2_g2~~TRINITY_DN5197_c2_g2_i1.p1  ORF type:complete len:129 (+),score=12.64 TRINITY_DN5197_c2_g2_i1:53-388(+)